LVVAEDDRDGGEKLTADRAAKSARERGLSLSEAAAIPQTSLTAEQITATPRKIAALMPTLAGIRVGSGITYHLKRGLLPVSDCIVETQDGVMLIRFNRPAAPSSAALTVSSRNCSLVSWCRA
jgi:hypothetical protein